MLGLLALPVLAVAVGLGTIELWLRAHPGFSALGPPGLYAVDPERGLVLRPGACERERSPDGTSEVEYCVDERGFRRTELPEGAKGPPILLLGGAEVFGLGVGDAETTASRLAKRLGRQVVNAGVPGRDLPGTVADLVAARNGGVDARIVVLGVDLGRDWREPGQPPAAAALPVWERWLRLHSRVYAGLRGDASGRTSDERLRLGLLPQDADPLVARMAADLRAVGVRAARAGPESGLVVMIIPTRYQVDGAWREEVCREHGPCADAAESDRSAEALRTVSKKLSLPRVDMDAAFTEPADDALPHPYLARGVDDAVWTADAHAAAAEDLARMIFFIEQMQARARTLAKEKS